MSAATFILATHDPELLRAWWVFVPAGARVVTLSELVQGEAILPAGLPSVLVTEESVVGELPRACLQMPMVFVGDQHGEIYERLAQTTRSTRVCLTKPDSHTRLGELLPLLEQIATHGASANLLWDKSEQPLARAPLTRTRDHRADTPDFWWDSMGDAVETIGSREGLLAEFRRMAKRSLRTSHVVFFLREDTGYRSDRGGHFCANNDAVIQYLARHPVAIDGINWVDSPKPVVELSIRQRMALWSISLIVPLHDNGRLAGWMGLGVRDDGRPYDAADCAQATSLGRLMRQMLACSPRTGGGGVASESWQLASKYLPGVLILGAGEAPSDSTPPAVRSLIAEVRQLRVTRRIAPVLGQPIRASAGIVAETQGVWVSWEDASVELQEQHRRARAERLTLLHDLALTLNHELGNSLVSLAALRHNPGAETNSPVLLAAIKRDIASLEAINRHLASLPTFSEVAAESVDLRALVCSVGRKCGVMVETGSQEVPLDVAPKLIEFGLESIIDSIAENRPGLGKRDLVVSLRTAGSGEGLSAVLSIRGAGLALEGILPAPEPGATPTQGRIGVFIAKEIIHLHGGTIQAGTGTNGPEISITIRQW